MQIVHEFFDFVGNTHSISNNIIKHESSLPQFFYNLIVEAIQEDKIAAKCLDVEGLTTESERVQKYYDCNYSAKDANPDVTACGQLGEREFVPCPNRFTCKHLGKLCKVPFGLTKRHLQIIGCIGEGMLNKEICNTLNIAPGTLKNHQEIIEQRTGLDNKPALAVLAHKLHLI